MKANRFAAINDNPILAQVPRGDWLGPLVCDMRMALNFHPGSLDLDPSLPQAQVASFMHCDLAEFLSRQTNG